MPSSPDFSKISAERDNYITHVGEQTANGSLERFLHCDCRETLEQCRHRINLSRQCEKNDIQPEKQRQTDLITAVLTTGQMEKH